jgi:mono/diheme cytochrome c family protein
VATKSQGSKSKQVWLKAITLFVAIFVMVLIYLVSPLLFGNGTAKYTNIEAHFKYGSIGGEAANGIPYWVWKALPIVFADKLPGEGYTSLGFIQESGQDLPIGFSQGKIGFNRVAQNCATCHAGTLRDTPDSKPQIITSMPSNTVNLEGYIRFLSEVAIDERFNASHMMPQIESLGANLNPLEKLVYRYFAIPQTRDALITQRSKFAFLDRQSEYGSGRVDTFSSYKTRLFNVPADKLPQEELNGIADFPSVWQQKPREGMQLHWDGNNASVNERNNSAALALVTPTTINFDAIHRVADWLWELPPPSYPYEIDRELASAGEQIYKANCASCHAFSGAKVGKVTPIEEIGTDRGRLDSYTYELLSNQSTLFAGISYKGEDQRFRHFQKTNGYANMPLDGVWLRAPYLHNGSVPTLRDLLEPPAKRPKEFYRGYDVFDPDKVGFVSNVEEEKGKHYFKLDITLPGNSNSGHLYGTNLRAKDKEALVEYLKEL